MRYTKRGYILAAEFGTVVGDHFYAIRIEATDRAASLLFALGVAFVYIGPEQDSGRAWYQFEYGDQLDDALKQLVDFIGDSIFNQPTFGQLMLFDEAEIHG